MKHSTTILATAATIILSITTITSCRDRIDDEPSTRTVTFNTSWTDTLLLSI